MCQNEISPSTFSLMTLPTLSRPSQSFPVLSVFSSVIFPLDKIQKTLHLSVVQNHQANCFRLSMDHSDKHPLRSFRHDERSMETTDNNHNKINSQLHMKCVIVLTTLANINVSLFLIVFRTACSVSIFT